jgi:hypothetical protein
VLLNAWQTVLHQQGEIDHRDDGRGRWFMCGGVHAVLNIDLSLLTFLDCSIAAHLPSSMLRFDRAL